MGWKSVAIPGYGSVTKSSARGCPCCRTRSPSPRADDLRAGVLELREEQVEVLGPRVLDRDVALGRDGRRRPRARFDPVGDGVVIGRTQLGHAVDRDRAAAGPQHLGAHRHQEGGQVGDLGLARRVVDHGGAAREHAREQEVLGRGHARVVERDRRAVQRRRLGDEEAVLGATRSLPCAPIRGRAARPAGLRSRLRRGARREPDRCGRAAARAPRSMRGSAAPGRVAPRRRSPRSRRATAVPSRRSTADAEVLQQLGHDGAVADPRHVAHDASPRRQQRGGHQLERGILGARHPNGSLEARATGDEEPLHRPMVDRQARRFPYPATTMRASAFATSAAASSSSAAARACASSRRARAAASRRSGPRARRSRPRRRPASPPRPRTHGGSRRRRPRPATCRPPAPSGAARSRAAPAGGRAPRRSRPSRPCRGRRASRTSPVHTSCSGVTRWTSTVTSRPSPAACPARRLPRSRPP